MLLFCEVAQEGGEALYNIQQRGREFREEIQDRLDAELEKPEASQDQTLIRDYQDMIRRLDEGESELSVLPQEQREQYAREMIDEIAGFAGKYTIFGPLAQPLISSITEGLLPYTRSSIQNRNDQLCETYSGAPEAREALGLDCD